MKIAVLFIEQIQQVIFTPETDDEKALLKVFRGDKVVQVHTDHQFYYSGTRGGWIREFEHGNYDRSVMLTLRDEQPEDSPGDC